MSKYIDYYIAKEVMGNNVIGVEEIKRMKGFDLLIPDTIPQIPYSKDELEQKKKNYLLILRTPKLSDGSNITIRRLIELFGKDPSISEPCFYNQDWYDNESFIDISIQPGWMLIRKNVFDDSRAMQPDELSKRYVFPSAVSCVYSFFVAWKSQEMKLWYHDFVWCSDTDHNGDRIYVGRYHDADGINKNGFSIHRHLALRSCYGCID